MLTLEIKKVTELPENAFPVIGRERFDYVELTNMLHSVKGEEVVSVEKNGASSDAKARTALLQKIRYCIKVKLGTPEGWKITENETAFFLSRA